MSETPEHSDASATPAGGAPSEPNPADPSQVDPNQADPTLRSISDASLRLLAGAVSKARMEQLRRTVEQAPSEYPWQVVVQAILEEQVDQQRLVQQGLTAQRDWILRGGRTTRGPSLTRRAKGLLARLMAQLIFAVIFTIVLIAGLIVVQMQWEWLDIYAIVPWFRELVGI